MKEMDRPEREIIHMGVFNQRKGQQHRHPDLEIFFVMQGCLDFQLGDTMFQAEENDFFFVPPGEYHAHFARSAVLYCCMRIDSRAVSPFIEIDRLRCAIGASREDTYENRRFRKKLRRMLSLHLLKEKYSELLLQSACYDFLYFLGTYYAEQDGRKDDKETMRLKRIRDWMYRHYREDVQLNDLAEYMGLTPSYLSKYFKRLFGKNFLGSLTDLRLEEVCNDMKNYPERSILRIAYDNGFSNINSFNKFFKQSYGLKPSEYRAGLKDVLDAVDDPDALEALGEYINSAQPEGAVESPRGHHFLARADLADYHEAAYSWNRLLNAGRAGSLSLSEVREHILRLTNELGIEYVRIGDIYSEELHLYDPESGRCDFSYLDQAVDFLYKNHLHLYLDITPLAGGERVFPGPEAFAAFLEAFVEHYSRWIPKKEWESWCFELRFDLLQSEEEAAREYFACLAAARRALKKRSPAVRVGGPGMEASGFLKLMKRSPLPAEGSSWDFVSLYYYGDSMSETDAEWFLYREDQFQELAEKLRSRLDSCGCRKVPIHITDWCFSASDSNYLSDSVFNAAYIVKNCLDLLGDKIELVSHGLCTDLLLDYQLTREALFGGSGILSKDGLRKPAYYAYYFLECLEPYVLCRGENFLATTDGMGAIRVICHNYVHPGPSYRIFSSYATEEFFQLFEDGEDLVISFELKGVTAGRYLVKSQFANEDDGNPLQAWAQMKELGTLSIDDRIYLQSRSIPKTVVEACPTEQGVLRWKTTLRPNEFRLILFTPSGQP